MAERYIWTCMEGLVLVIMGLGLACGIEWAVRAVVGGI